VLKIPLRAPTLSFPRSTDTSGVGSVILVCPGVEGLEGDGAVHSDAGMASFGIVPALYLFEDSVGKFVAGLPFFRVEYFKLHGAPEGLHHGIVVAVPNGAYGSE
jgi:hypothetical protein